MLNNAWRECGEAVYNGCAKVDKDIAHKACSSLPPRPLTSRWLSMTEHERAIYKFGEGKGFLM